MNRDEKLKHYCDSLRSLLGEDNEKKQIEHNIKKMEKESAEFRRLLLFKHFYDVRIGDTSLSGEGEIEIDIIDKKTKENIITLTYGYKDSLLNRLDEDDEYWDEVHYLGDDCQGIFSYDGMEEEAKFTTEIEGEKDFFYEVIQSEVFKNMIGEYGDILSEDELVEKIDTLIRKIRQTQGLLQRINEKSEKHIEGENNER